MPRCEHSEASGPARFDVYSGKALSEDGQDSRGAVKASRGALAGLEPPRFCAHCGRRMQVQVHPMGWTATCSRHGHFSSEDLPDGPL
ncbi:biotin synthase auxiliary protein BsaP [Corynebacterium dentalis]|uniref:biotin synthase auxiliary protein BsaP n=1 Tax=Corynebacterium dentalis TaxID=2014528 RepID=UPI000C08B500|nr:MULTISPECIES: hypothetical protein [Corynebacterium]